MQALILNMVKQSDATLSRDRSRDLVIISHCDTLKHEARLAIINIISILIVL
jgi:hypothetical protein